MDQNISARYVLFSSGYENKLINDRASDLEQFCNEYEILPLGIYHHKELKLFQINKNDQYEFLKFQYINNELVSILVNNSCDFCPISESLHKDIYSGILFKVDDLGEAYYIQQGMKSIGYCKIIDIKLSLYEGMNSDIYLYIQVNAENC